MKTRISENCQKYSEQHGRYILNQLQENLCFSKPFKTRYVSELMLSSVSIV